MKVNVQVLPKAALKYLNPTFTKSYNILITKKKTLSLITKFPAVLVRPQETTGTLLELSEAFCGVLALLLSYRVVHGIFYGIPYFESQGTFKNTVNIMQVHCKTGNFYPSLPVIVEIRHENWYD